MTREEAIKTFIEYKDDSIEKTIREWEEYDKKMYQAIDMAIEALQDRPTGTWEEKYIEDAPPFLKHRFYCSNCGEWITYGTADFCCHCGADMRVKNDDERSE